MKPVHTIILGVIGGIVVGFIVNMGLVTAGPFVIPLPDGADTSTTEGLREAMKSFTPANFVFPFLAHALGTLAGAFVAAKLAARHHMKVAMGLGVFFLLGGIAAVIMLGGPVWFIATDLLVAYLPMAWLGAKLAGPSRPAPAAPAPVAAK